jgi:hypothetical protein
MAEIKLRAVIRIGEISRSLEKAENQYARPDGRTSKTEQLAEGFKGNQYNEVVLTTEKKRELESAGISVPTAHRYEQLAAPDAQDGLAIAPG